MTTTSRPVELDAEIDPSAPRAQPASAPRWAGPLIGIVSAGAAVAVGMITAAIIDVDSPLDAVGSEFIDHTPAWLKNLAIDLFDTNDKVALRVGIVITIALLSLCVGALARRHRAIGAAVIGVFGVLGGVVAADRPGQGADAAIPALLGAIVGAGVLWYLAGVVARSDPARESPGLHRARSDFDRRRFMVTTGSIAAGAALLAVAARRREAQRVDELAAAAPDTLPSIDIGTAEIDGVGLEIPAGATLSPITPFLTPNDDFYLIDTALSVPRINLGNWAVDIDGRVDRPLRFTYGDLLARPQVERVITIACVSNEVGGDLIGTAVWQGVLLADLLREAGVRPEAQQVFSTSVDGWTCGFPVEVALDGRDAMIAIGMNGEPLPVRHGFPARLIVPGVYGYVSATKWLSRIELTTWDEAVGYWVPRGWAREAPVKTQSRIDVPRRGDALTVGPTVIAGIAWAQHRGIAKVEVRIDDGEWSEAELGTDVTDDTWRQWRLPWNATAGEHTIQVRATDNDGQTQTDEVSRPDPDGATGWHTRTVNVSG